MSLLVNQVTSPAEGRAVYDRIAKVARQFLGVGLFDAGFIYADETVPQSVRRRVPFVMTAPRCPAAMCVTQLAIRLEQDKAAPAEQGGFFRRMSRWLKM